jgi:hypothetical protein
MMKRTIIHFIAATAVVAAATIVSHAQTTTFNYQGRLTEGGNPANGAYQMQFKLFDAVVAGNQIGSTLNDVPVTVSQGLFSIKLDFGIAAFSGASRWIEIAVRHSSSEFYTVLSPREQITSSPYSVRTIYAGLADDALKLGGTPASDYLKAVGGNVGIGTLSPQQKLHIVAPAGNNAAALVQTPAGFFAQYQLASGSDNPWIIGAQDNFSNGALLFRNGATDLMAIRQTGNVGIGTNSPIAKLTINGGGLNGYSLLTTEPVSIGGFMTQPRDKGGVIKAAIYVNGDGSMIRCYNGVSGSSTGDCGISASHSSGNPGRFTIVYPFQIHDRFWVGNAIDPQGGYLFSVFLGQASTTILVVEIRDAENNLTDRPFMLVVY